MDMRASNEWPASRWPWLGILPVCWAIGALVSPAEAQLAIANAGTSNPTMLYGGRPMLKVGPLPEVAVFSSEWGSRDFPHRAWLDWMAAHRLGYGRVYPESGYPWDPWDLDRRVLPFEIARRQDGRPLVDIEKSNHAYWTNVARVIGECRDRGIVLQMQLYQRVFFENRQGKGDALTHAGKPVDTAVGWSSNYFNPECNVNDYPVPRGPRQNGYGLWDAMAGEQPWQAVHRGWVERILGAIGDKGNVIVDLMNEGALKNLVTERWIETTLDIIEDWERRTGNDLLVGMDFDHFYKKQDPGLEYVLAHPRMDVLICEGSEGHVVKELTAGTRKPLSVDLAADYRRRYRKPIVSTNSPAYGAEENPYGLRLYQWYAMMVKVQGVGVYAKTYPLDFDSQAVRSYARESKILVEFFETLRDYAALDLATDRIETAPGKYRLALTSPEETVVYLHAGELGRRVEAGSRLRLKSLAMPEGPARATILHPRDGRSESIRALIRGGGSTIELPEFVEDVVVHLLPGE